jgi:hypothetical protein
MSTPIKSEIQAKILRGYPGQPGKDTPHHSIQQITLSKRRAKRYSLPWLPWLPLNEQQISIFSCQVAVMHDLSDAFEAYSCLSVQLDTNRLQGSPTGGGASAQRASVESSFPTCFLPFFSTGNMGIPFLTGPVELHVSSLYDSLSEIMKCK